MNIIEQIAKRKGISVAKISELTGWSRQTTYNRIAKPKRMSLEDVAVLSKALRQSPRNLFSLIINN